MTGVYGQILRKLREAKGRAQAEVARKADISPAQLARLESDQRGLYVEDFVRIVEVLGEKPGNLLPNDLGHIGHLKPLIDRLAGVEPQFLQRIEAIVEKVVLLTDDVITTTRVEVDHNGSHKMSPQAIARLETVLKRARRFSGIVSAEKGIVISDRAGDIPKWAAEAGARGVLKASGTSMRDEGIFDGDLLFVRPDRHPPSGKLVIGSIHDRVFVKHFRRDHGRRPGDNVEFYFVVVGIEGQR
ncbi:MAG TPA: helix-turn-helix domain-containing protein [Thermoanaerobaculia bacterium]